MRGLDCSGDGRRKCAALALFLGFCRLYFLFPGFPSAPSGSGGFRGRPILRVRVMSPNSPRGKCSAKAALLAVACLNLEFS